MNCAFIFLDRIAVYKAIYPTVGVLSDVLAAIDQVIINSEALSSEFLGLRILVFFGINCNNYLSSYFAGCDRWSGYLITLSRSR